MKQEIHLSYRPLYKGLVFALFSREWIARGVALGVLSVSGLGQVAMGYGLLASPNQPWTCHAEAGRFVCQSVMPKPSLYSTHLTAAQNQQALVHALGWVNDSDPQNCSVCGGHYVLPGLEMPGAGGNLSLLGSPAQGTYRQASYKVNGDVVLEGPILISQPGRSLFVGQEATLYPNLKTGQLERISAQGDVQLYQPGQLLLANSGGADLFMHQAKLQEVTYLVRVKPNWRVDVQDPNFTGYAYGQAREIDQENQNVVTLYDTTYSTCAPTADTWQLRAGKIVLDRSEGEGRAYNTTLRVHDVPLLYTPYLSFPITDARKSGFLYGTIAPAGSSGFYISAPYYLNLAPNYDDTFTPTFYARGGGLFSNEFRYLNSWLDSDTTFSYVPHDWIRDLGARGQFSTDDSADFGHNWQANLNYNYVTDDYFLQDFNSTDALSANQVLLNREFNLNYTDLHWQFTGLLQGYQVINSLLSLQNTPYQRLPELDLSAEYPQLASPFALSFSSQFVNFQQSPFAGQTVVNGQRENFSPTLSLPMAESFGYLTPTLTSSLTSYQLYNNLPGSGFPDSNINRTVPIFSLDSGLYFDRGFNFGSQQYTQSVEPRLFYLYVPEVDQNNIPIFDTTIPNFTYDSLFTTNRFSGLDRIGDANQLSYALSSNISNSSGQTLISAGVGQIAYFSTRQTLLCQQNPLNPFCSQWSNDPSNTSHFSDYAGYLNYALGSSWSLNNDLTYSPSQHQFDFQSYQLQYKPDDRHLFNIGYQNNQQDYALMSTQELIAGVSPPLLSQLTTSFVWGLTPTWSALGLWNYAFNASRVINEYAGLEYNACCWAVRFVYGRYFVNSNPNIPSALSGPLVTTTMLQFQLKGLGSTNNSQIEALEQQIPGYVPNQSGFN